MMRILLANSQAEYLLPKRGLYEGIRHEESFELSTNIFDHTSYNYMTTESLYSTKSSKPHSDVPTVNQSPNRSSKATGISYSQQPSRAHSGMTSLFSTKSSKPSWQTQSSTGSSHFGSSKPSRPYGPKSYKPSLTSSSPVDSTSNPSYSSKSYKPSYTTTRGPSYSSKSYKPSPTSASPSAPDRTSRSPSYGSKSYKPSYTTSREPSYSSKSYKPSYTTRSSSQPSKTPTAG
ncbi:hypothetical protein ACHAXN_010768, partial [Cyclotella atomus]